MPEPVLVTVAHGSADPRARDTIGQLTAMAAERDPGLDLRIAYLNHERPSLPQVMGAIDPLGPVTVLPLLLTAAYHSKTDIPRVLARFRHLQIGYGTPLGPHPLLLRALERRLTEADPDALEDPAPTGVVLAPAGSSDPDANTSIARLGAWCLGRDSPGSPGPFPGGPEGTFKGWRWITKPWWPT